MAKKTKNKQGRKVVSKSVEPTDGAKSPRRFGRYFVILLLTGVVALTWLSVLTYSPTDPPSPTVSPPRSPVDNAAGRVGAFLAYHLHYWVGGGAYMALLFASVAAVVLMLGGRIGDLPWRLVGLVLLVTATSAGVYMLNPSGAADVYRSSAGVLGINTGQFLLSIFSAVGAWIIVAIVLGIGLMFTADNLVLTIPRFGKRFGQKLWQKRKELPSMAGAIRTVLPKPEATSSGAAARPSNPPRPVFRPAPRVARPVAPTPGVVAPPRPAPKSSQATQSGEYELPSPELLAEPVTGYIESQREAAVERQQILQQTLDDFNVVAEVVGHMTGPVITMYELSLAPGVKVSQVANLATDIARALAVPGVRIVPPRFGKHTVGIEVPNTDKEIVRIRELMDLRPDAESKMHLPLYLGKDAAGEGIVADLAVMPHILIAGTTGSGKSVCINTILMSMLMTRRPEELRLILVDPKMVEMAAFENLPHLLCPIVNDMRKAEDILEWAATKMDERYEILKEAGVRNLASYNRLGAEEIYKRLKAKTDEEKARVTTRLPHIIIVIDELADLMMTSSKEVESHIIRIAQKARAVGIHLVLATQRPSVNVVTGLIKSNMPCRISFRVASRQESRIVLDQNGAEVLLGQGDMLFLQPGTSNLIRAQGAYVDDQEIRAVVQELHGRGEPEFNAELVRLQSQAAGEFSGEKDELFDKAVEIVLASQRGSVSLLQRRLQVGYSRASRIIDQMADAGFLGEYKGSQARECLMDLEDWHTMQKSIAADQSGASALDGTPTSA